MRVCVGSMRQFISLCNILVLHKDFNKPQLNLQAIQGKAGSTLWEELCWKSAKNIRYVVDSSRCGDEAFLAEMYPTHICRYQVMAVKGFIKI